MGDYAPFDYYGQFMAPLQKSQQLDLEQQQVDMQKAAQRQQQQAAAQKIAEIQAYKADAQDVISNPTPDGFRKLLLKYPEMHESLKSAADQYSEGQKDRNSEAASQVYSSLANGQPDLALKLLKDRKDALTKGGESTEVTDQVISLVESGDPAKIKQAQGIAGFALAQTAGPEKIGPMLEALGMNGGGGVKGQVVGRAIGHYENGEFKVDYRDPDAPQYRELDVTGPDGQTHKAIVAVGGDGQPTSAPAPNNAAAGGFDVAVGKVLGHEGGFNPKDLNGSPTMRGINWKANASTLTNMGFTPATFKTLSEDQAKQIYRGYWDQSGAASLPANMQAPYFDVYIRNPKFAKAALAKSDRDPTKFMDLADTYFSGLAKSNPAAKKYAQAWTNRDAENRAIATGTDTSQPYYAGAPGATPGNGQPNVVAMGAASAASGGEALTPEALDAETTNWILTGKMSPLGMGNGPLRVQILNNRAKVMRRAGITDNQLPAIQAQFGADTKAYVDRVKTLSFQKQSMNGALQHGEQIKGYLKDLPDQIGFRPLNAMSNAYLKATNDPSMVNLEATIPLLKGEVARVMTGNPASGAGQLSDEARREFSILEGAALPKSKVAAINALNKMMQGKIIGDEQETQRVQERLSGGLTTYAGGKASSAKTVVRTGRDKSGRRVVQYSDGSIAYAN